MVTKKNNSNSLLHCIKTDFKQLTTNRVLHAAQSKFFRKEYERCISLCNRIDGDKKTRAIAKALHAACLKDNAESKALLHEALELDPNCMNALSMLGQIHQNEKNYSEAIQQYKMALNISKSDEIYVLIVSTYLAMSDFEGALFFAKEGLQFQHQSPNLNFLMAMIIIDSPKEIITMEDYNKVLKYLDVAEKAGISKDKIYWYKAKYLFEIKEYAKAYETISEYLHINYYDNEARWLHNMCLFYLGDLINFVGYVLELYDESDNFAIHLVNKYNLLDFEEEVFKDSFTKEQVLDLNKRILFRVRDLNQSK